jgi:mannose-6-phosphate isomerase-like protein (cupin superfamily)
MDASTSVTKVDFEEIRIGPTAFMFEGDGRGAGVSSFIVRTPPGEFVELHVHPYPETFVLLKGRGRWTAGDVIEELEPDQIIVVPPYAPHGFRNIGDEPLLVVSMHESPRVIQDWLDEEPA